MAKSYFMYHVSIALLIPWLNLLLSSCLVLLDYFVFYFAFFLEFNSEVERVHPEYDSNKRLTWLVRVRDLTKSEDNVMESVFDAVMICNG